MNRGSDLPFWFQPESRRLEITSPGPLPDTMPLDELGTGRSEIRNRILAPVFKDLKLIEAWGTGIQKMRKEILNYTEIELILQEAGHAFQVQFKKKAKTGQVPDKLKLLEFCREDRSIKEMMVFLNIRRRETFLINYIRPLLQDNFLAMTGGKYYDFRLSDSHRFSLSK